MYSNNLATFFCQMYHNFWNRLKVSHMMNAVKIVQNNKTLKKYYILF